MPFLQFGIILLGQTAASYQKKKFKLLKTANRANSQEILRLNKAPRNSNIQRILGALHLRIV